MDPHTRAPLARPLPAAVPHQPGQPAPGSAGAHTASTADRGAFCLAVCTCGWKGPARRSRDLARKDAARHGADRPQAPGQPGDGGGA